MGVSCNGVGVIARQSTFAMERITENIYNQIPRTDFWPSRAFSPYSGDFSGQEPQTVNLILKWSSPRYSVI